MDPLIGRVVRLRPLTVEDAPALFPSASDPEVWRWKLVARPTSVETMAQLIESVMTKRGREPFTAERLDDGAVVGSTMLANVDAHHRTVEMGFTWLDRSCWGHGINEDMKRLLLGHCFGDRSLERVECQADARNVRSRRALVRCGFTEEGTLRSRLRLPDGSRRDSVYFSVLRPEWPAVEARLGALIDERSDPSAGRPQAG